MKRGEIRPRLDTAGAPGPLRLVISSDMWHAASPYAVTCAVAQAQPVDHHAAVVPIPGSDWSVIPGMLAWMPMAALGPVAWTVPTSVVEDAQRILKGIIL